MINLIHYTQLPKRLTKSFKYWEIQELTSIFGLSKQSSLPILEEWMNSASMNGVSPFSDQYQSEIEELALFARDKVDYWNEEELKMKS
jgi:hypothetical protein